MLKKKIPTGILNYRKLRGKDYYTVDKSLMIEELAKEAIKQVQVNHYDFELAGEIIYIGLAQCGKEIAIEWKQK